MKRKNWLSWITVLVLGMFMAMSGGCGDGGENHGADPVPEGNWTDVGNYDTTWKV
ncbi:MAG: hypothetical protein LBE65_04035 [Synergistaceae bacterium]|nr:hypothetical protein [Synergistaceae bacterium]